MSHQQEPLSTPEVALRVGTWNVLSYDDEYNIDYGSPLSISFCHQNHNNDTSVNCTKARYQRIWMMLEELSDKYDIICLQEVSDEFLALQHQSSSLKQQEEQAQSVSFASNWTIVHRNQECVILSSNFSQFHIITTYHISTIPNLSGCNALPMVVLQQQQQQVQDSSSSPNKTRISYLVGSVHVQASVTNMTLWYQSTVDAILNTTYHEVMDSSSTPASTSYINANNSSTTFYDWMQYPVMIILGGDFNHNITTVALTDNTTKDIIPLEIEQPPKNWTLVAPSSTEILVKGTTQKEYNYMGNYDGFLVSTIPMMLLQYPPSQLLNIAATAPNDTTVWNFNITNAFVNMKGFIPKVVYGFPQNQNRSIQTIAQFALVSIDNKKENNDTTTMSWNNTIFWNDTMVKDYYSNNQNDTVLLSDLQLLFSPCSDFTNASEMITIVPYSHPIHEVLSDHLFVSASFTAIPVPQNSSNNNNSNDNDVINTRKSGTFLSQLTPFGRACVFIIMLLGVVVFAVRLLWKRCYCRRNSSPSSTLLHQEEFDRVPMTDTPLSIQ